MIMKNPFNSERAVILRTIAGMHKKVIVPLLSVSLIVGAVSVSMLVSSLQGQVYSKTPSPEPKASVKTVKQVTTTNTATTISTAPTQTPAPAPRASAPAVKSTKPAVVTPSPTPAVVAAASDFSIKNGASSGFPIATNVALDANLSFKAGYDKSQAVIITFDAPVGFTCPPVSLLPSAAEHTVPFTCYLAENFTMGHKLITMTATNGASSSTAIYDLNITSINGR